MNYLSQKLKYLIIGINLLSTVSLYADEIPTQIYLKPTEKNFQVNLPDNPSTGYVWKVKKYDKFLLRVAPAKHDIPLSEKMGEGLMIQFNFEVIYRSRMPKFTIIVFKHLRPWDPDSEILQTVTVSFQEDAPMADPFLKTR